MRDEGVSGDGSEGLYQLLIIAWVRDWKALTGLVLLGTAQLGYLTLGFLGRN